MPRVGRIYQRALCYHVMNRGVNGHPIYGEERDREYFSETVADYKEVCGARVYLGGVGDAERVVYGERLMSGADEEIVRQMEGERAIGRREFAATLKMERGRYRVRRGRPVRSV